VQGTLGAGLDQLLGAGGLPQGLRVNALAGEWAMDLQTQTREVGDVTVVDLRGRIVLGEESASVRDLLASLLSEGHVKILLNMSGVDYMDSSGLGMLVSSMASVRKAGGEMKLLNLSDKVDDLMEITRLYTVFDIEDDEQKALALFGRSAAAGA
jgi:anti-sigma B factor antagonist